MLILSPSKGQDFDTPAPVTDYTLPAFADRSMELIRILRTFSTAELSGLMQISDKLALLNRERYASFSLPFTPENAKQAIFAFTGDVYRGIEAEQYSPDELDYAQKNIRILSGLYGLLRPLDLIQPYRLEMKTRLTNPRGDNLYTFWGTKIAEKLNLQVPDSDTNVLFNLASNEYFRVLPKKSLQMPVIDLLFKERKNGEYKTIAVHAKRARGMMADYMVRNRLTEAEAVKDFQQAGYRYNPDLSAPERFVFTREHT